MKAYKVFNSDWTCRGFKYRVGETYEEKVSPSVCERGFHFCKKLADCFNYYNFDPNNKVAEIEALGDITDGDDKCCTNVIKIVKELTWHEVLEMVNIGNGNTGLRNTGHRNSGEWNSGDQNSGDQNSGDQNSGDQNSGYWNSGDQNSGYWNSGDQNSGYWNSGNQNSGYWNSGNQNSGYWNSGNWNSGDFNISDNNTGCFNVESHKLLFFDQETEMTWNQWRNSRAYDLLWNVDSRPAEWVYADDMTDQEKSDYPTYETTDGYLKERDISKAYQEWWDQLSDDKKHCIKDIPNFDAKKFHQITGINV
jgi:hypothetical protein